MKGVIDMIVTSKRCFLNKFIQRNTPETVLNANYYVCDRVDNRSGNSGIQTPNLVRNEYGEIEDTGSFTVETADQIGSIYHIRTDSILDPQSYTSHVLDGKNEYKSGEERYINFLNNPDTMVRVFYFLFGHQLEGNGLQIAIFEDDENLLRFGHIACQYLSQVFGVDIIFLDPVWRPKCNGVPKYPGNKEYGAYVCNQLMDYSMKVKFGDAVAQSMSTHSLSNIREHLATFDIYKLMHLYNLLYPDAPLPEGNYSEDQLREILVYRASAGINTDITAFSNLLIQHDWSSIVDRASQEAMDFSYDDGYDSGLF